LTDLAFADRASADAALADEAFPEDEAFADAALADEAFPEDEAFADAALAGRALSDRALESACTGITRESGGRAMNSKNGRPVVSKIIAHEGVAVDLAFPPLVRAVFSLHVSA